jgi:tonB family C-terminal domain
MSIKSLSSALALSIAFTAGSFTASYAESPDGCNAGYEITRNQIGPEFPGGPSEMIMCISRNLHYPAEAYANHIEGRVVVQFVVTKTGAVGQVRVVRGVSPDLDAEAVRVVKLLPDFNPGTLNGEPVNVWMTLPIVFKIPEEIPSDELLVIKDDSDYEVEEVRSMDEIENNENKHSDFDDIIRSGSHQEVVVVDEMPVPKEDPDRIYETVEQAAEFPGGVEGLMKFIADNLRYPAAAKENGIQGRVMVQFVIKKDGSIGQVNIVRKIDPECDAEAIRVIKTLPKFIPGKMNGRPVNSRYVLPVTFKITE